ncbi:hypothetical protein GCM10011507_34850 [Edaphobacter acidisoli]|uniref:HK97 gp10 family phage protein n=1 Tax=Edaphobacter acidisoli TaxID=2040573 RepID=A0A916S4T4_9BACT|nr:HK97 gp10 family phage protein [Edaphobacter acidisoli]GGA80666.1 hypothetical protein GCM10011507_34850 [Edaphobacter acidisoli]
MAEMEMDFRGFDALGAKMSALGEEITGATAVRMVRAGATVFRQEMVERAPVLDKKTTGSDSLEPGAMKAGIRILIPKNAVPVEGHIGPKPSLQRVAHDVEYGHREIHGGSLTLLGNGKTRGTGVAGEDVPPHPFVRPAFEAAQGSAEEAMMHVLDEVIGENDAK